jgi:hypothetical protein
MAGAVTFAAQASAEELWDPHLRGVDEGLAAGALPPPGVYGVVNNYWASYDVRDSKGKVVPGTSLSALVEVPIVLWATGIKVLGADYAVAIAQPFDYTSFQPLGGTGSGNWGTFNTVLIPGQLAWTFGDFHVKAGLSIYLDDASSTKADLVNGKLHNGGLPSGNGYTTIQPDLGLSWLSDGWNASASLHLAVPVDSTTATHYNYQSGDEFAADYTLTKALGKWTVGLGFHQQNQLNADTLNGVTVKDSQVTNLGVGPLVGYQFGGINVLAEWNHNIYTENDVAGDFFNVRFVVPLY